MPRFCSLLAWLMAALWLPATLHCATDQAGLLASAPSCCDHDEAPPPDDQTCGERCAVFDRGMHKVATENPTPAAPLLLAPVEGPAPIEPIPAVKSGGLARAADSPPDLARTWQFAARAALPPRAPSTLS